MSTHRLRQVQEIFERALELQHVEERSAFLKEACGDDEELRSDVESLLEHDERAVTDFMRTPDGVAVTGESMATGSTPIPADESENAAKDPKKTEGVPPAVHEIQGYRLLRELQRGGQGVTYQAIQESTKRKVAIKFMGRGSQGHATAEKRFQREIELIAQLRHPHIVSIFDSGVTSNGTKFYVMDYVSGLPLDRYVRDNQLDMEGTLALFRSVCEAVQYAHHHGVIHRDLKPSNILVEANGSPKVLDFGLAKSLTAPPESAISLSRDVVGTLPYMSPEQASGSSGEIDARSDIYALGVILYELLTGRYPYPVAAQIVEVLKTIAEAKPTPPTRAWTADSGVPRGDTRRSRSRHGCPIDDEVETIILTALQKERDRRYETVAAFSEDLSHYLRDEPIAARRDSHWYVLRKAVRRHRLAVCVGVAVITALVVLALIIMSQGAEHERLEDENARLKERIHLLTKTPDYAAAISQGLREDAPDVARAPSDACTACMRAYRALQEYDETGAVELLSSALNDYTRCAALDPRFSVVAHEGQGHVYFLRAVHAQRRGGTEDLLAVQEYSYRAISEYTAALKLDPHILRARSNRGHAFRFIGDYAAAVDDYAQVVLHGYETVRAQVKDAWRTYFNYGTSLRILGDSEGAVAQYDVACTNRPGYLYCDIMLALAHYDLEQRAEAEKVLTGAYEKAMKDNMAWEAHVVECLRGNQLPEELIASATKEGEKCEAFYYAGEAQLMSGHVDEANHLFRRCIESCTGKMSHWNERRLAEWRLSDVLEVLRDG